MVLGKKSECILLSVMIIMLMLSPVQSLQVSADYGLKLDKSIYTGVGDSMKITCSAPQYDMSEKIYDTVNARLTTPENPFGVDIVLRETDKSSATFEGIARFSSSQTSKEAGTIKISNGIQIHVSCCGYEANVVWRAYNGSLKLDKNTYLGIGTKAKVTLTDLDLNVNVNKEDEIKIKVTSTSNLEGIPVKLTEESPDSGTFSGLISFTAKAGDTDKLLVNYNDTITAVYDDTMNTSGSSKQLSASAIWKPATGSIAVSSSKLTGLSSTATITVTDSDKDLHDDIKETCTVKVTSGQDTKGIDLTLYETDVNAGIFKGILKFSNLASYPERNTIMVGAKSAVVVKYVDDWNSENKKYTELIGGIDFQYSEGVLSLSSDKPEGSGTYITITVTDLDANTSSNKETVPVKVTTSSNSIGLTLWLEETGNSTGRFSGKLYFSDTKVTDKDKKDITLIVSDGDAVNLTYLDSTTPDNKPKEITKTATWGYDAATISFDKQTYIGYNTTATITISDLEANEKPSEAERIHAKVSCLSLEQPLSLYLKETGVNTGVFKGTITFNKVTDKGKNKLSIETGDKITVSYEDQGKINKGTVTASAQFTVSDAVLTLDSSAYYGNEAAVRITLKDWDEAQDSSEKDEVKVSVMVGGNAVKIVDLTETGNNTGTFTGILYLNSGGKKTPYITVAEGSSFDIIYKDMDTTSKAATERKASATWSSKK